MEEDSDQCICSYSLEEIMAMPPLGFRSVATEPFRTLVESTLSKSAAVNVEVGSHLDKDKKKASASHFPITTLTVGNWKRESAHRGDLTAKFYYGKKKLVWEFLYGKLKSKMEVSWSDITAIEAVMNPNQPGFLRIELAKPPLFFREIPPQPRKHTTWEKVDDFTGGQAQFCRKHEAKFPPGALDKHYEKLLINDERLAVLSRKPFPTNESVFPLQQQQLLSSVLPLQKIPKQQLLSSVLPLHKIPKPQLSSSVVPLQKIPQHQLSSSVVPLQKIPQHQLFSSVVPLQKIPQHQLSSSVLPLRQFHHSLNSNIIAPSASSNSAMAAWGNHINNKPTYVDIYQYNDMAKPTFMGLSSQNPVAAPASTFIDSSRQNHPVVVPALTYVDGSSSENSSVVTDDHNDIHVDRYRCLPRFMRQGLSEAQYLAQNAANADEEANATSDDEPWSFLDLYIKQSQEYSCNEPVGDGNVNEASSVSPAPPSRP